MKATSISNLRRFLNRFQERLTGSFHRNAAAHRRVLTEIRGLESALHALSDAELQNEAAQFRLQAREAGTRSISQAAFFALAGEIVFRRLGLRLFDVQFLGAMALDDGHVVEMATGEGKTLTAVLPVARGALAGHGYHVLAANDYLARRDAAWMEPVYSALGLSVRHVCEGMARAERRAAYAADVTYIAATEAGFDYLRDRLATHPSETVQRPFNSVLVDEVDSILIDEARHPLVIAGGAIAPGEFVAHATRAAQRLTADQDYIVDPGLQSVVLTEKGVERLETMFNCGNLFESDNNALLATINVALHAVAVLCRDVDYIVRNGEIHPVDEFKGRVAEDRRWSGGVHTAIEAKEGLSLTCEGQILGTLTLQSFINLYPRVSGMTGTAALQAVEFRDRYNLKVVVIPPNRPCIRKDLHDLVFYTREAKEAALIADIRTQHALGRPILIGTASVKESEHLARCLRDEGIDCRVLNARNDDLEAEIVEEAGDLGAVTISTNMAGRGTDIKLGGARMDREREVKALGGLLVVGTNRHEARRIDLQLRGRAGRQGEPGESRFYLSLEDDLFVRHGLQEELPPSIQDRFCSGPILDPRVGLEIARAQRILEGKNAAKRSSLWEYDLILNYQRDIVYRLRDDILAASSYLADRAPEQHRALASRHGAMAAAEVERLIALTHLDRHWTDYLAEITDLREGIELRSLGRQDPVNEFQRIATELFRTHLEAMENDAVGAFLKVVVDDDMTSSTADIPLKSTWTYILNEESLGTADERLLRGVARLFKGGGKGD